MSTDSQPQPRHTHPQHLASSGGIGPQSRADAAELPIGRPAASLEPQAGKKASSGGIGPQSRADAAELPIGRPAASLEPQAGTCDVEPGGERSRSVTNITMPPRGVGGIRPRLQGTNNTSVTSSRDATYAASPASVVVDPGGTEAKRYAKRQLKRQRDVAAGSPLFS